MTGKRLHSYNDGDEDLWKFKTAAFYLHYTYCQDFGDVDYAIR